MSTTRKTPKLRFPEFTDDWEQRKVLNEVNSIDTGKSKFEAKESGEFEILGSTGVIGYDDSYDYEGDFLLTARVGANAGTLYRHSGKVKITDNTVFLQGNHIDFIFYLLDKFDLKKMSFGSGQPLIKASEVKSLELQMPTSNEEKEKIAEYFLNLDNLITLHQRELDSLKKLKKSLLQKMFPKNGEKIPELRFPEFTGDWEQRKVNSLIEEFSEKTTQNNQYPVLTSSRKGIFLQTDYFSGNQVASIDNTGYNIVPKGYFTYRHMSDDEIFYFNINDIVDRGIVSTLYPVFKAKDKVADSYFLRYVLNYGEEFRKYAILQKQGGSRTYMYLKKLKELELTIPHSFDEQVVISTFLLKIDNIITLHQRELDTLKKLKKGLLQNMFV
ncbi:MAG: restriction endonuclease subunit S [Succinivibrio sp.]|nr:restriction endonuclease subunit S [Succinivibrio sp.]